MKVYIISSRSPLWIMDNRLFITLYFPFVSEENIKRQTFKYSTTLVKVDDKEINKIILKHHKTK